jgi:hypothetical protein
LQLKKQHGFTYIIIVTFIAVFLTALLLLIKPFNNIDCTPQVLSDNYKNELTTLIGTGINNISDINEFNNSFKNYIQSHNYNVKLCNIIDDRNQYIYISNYLGESCGLYVNSVMMQTLDDRNSIRIDRFINDMNIYLCNCNLRHTDGYSSIYYIDVYSSKTNIINKT